MKDLDFDELDRAVNSLMAGVPKASATPSQPAEKMLEISSTANDNEASRGDIGNKRELSAATLPVKTAVSRGSVSSSPEAPALRRGGRFMDVVHPSSAMKKPEPARPVSRQGVTIAPEKALTTLKESTSALATPLEVPSPPIAKPDTKTSSPAARSDWPDPLEIAGFDDEKEVEKEGESAPTQVETVESTPIKPTESAEAPLISPFLSDTKVDKRPLGANATTTLPDNEPVNPDTASSEELDDQLPATLADTKPLLPEELHGDLMAIESDTTEPDTEPANEKEDIPAVTSKREESSKPEVKKDPEMPKPEQPMPVPTGPVSIPQQYKEEPSSDQPESGAIYDTDSYHQPLAHPAKQKSGWMWVVWIVLILLLGVGVGAAVYFFKLA